MSDQARILLPPSAAHTCVLPDASELPSGTLARCEGCGEWSKAVERYAGFGYSSSWSALRWFEWRSRRRTRADDMRRLADLQRLVRGA